MKLHTPKEMPRRWSLCLSLIGAAGLLWGGAGSAGARDGTSEVTNKATSAVAPGTNAMAIPLAEIAAQAEAAFANLHSIDGALPDEQATATIQEDLPILTKEADARHEESSRMLSSSPSLETLRRLAREWQGFRDEFAEWKRSLKKRVAQVEEERGRLAQMEQTWEATRSSAAGSKTPPEVLAQVERVLAAVRRVKENADSQQQVLLTLQTRIAQQDGRALHELNAIEGVREAFLRRLLVRDSPPIWSAQLWSESARDLAQESYHSLSRQVEALRGYIERKTGRLALHGILFLAILCGLVGAGRRLRALGGEQAGHAALIFDAPVATALVLSLLASSWIYPQAPRLFWAICGAVALIPTTLVVRRLIDRALFPVLNALVAFYFLDQLRMVAASQATVSRALLLVEMLGGAVFVAWLLGPARFGAAADVSRRRRAVVLGCRIAFGVFGAAFIADATGYVNLSKLLGHALLQSAYMALSLYALVRIFDGLVLSLLSIPPLARLGLVQRHRGLLQNRAEVVLEWTAILLWAAYLLETLSLRAPVFQNLKEALAVAIGKGSFKFTLGDIAWFGITLWASFLISRVLRFVLEEEVYPRVELAPGLHYSISKMVNYAILVLGFLIGVALLGFDLTKLTILVGALGVGLGFGLQNIINNFVSGLILLFERPIKVGDVIQLGGNEGTVKRIGIRASIVRLMNGAELIVPNGSLISETVTNWTLSDRLRRIDLPLALLAPADARQVLELLQGAAAKQPLVLKEPPPKALLTGFDKDSVNFELRFWTNQSDDWSKIRSELAVAVRAALVERSIAVK
jgi:potassium-dependent mechanosensitive channel